MTALDASDALQQAASLLQAALDEMAVVVREPSGEEAAGVHLLVQIGPHSFAMHWSPSEDAPRIARGLRMLGHAREALPPGTVPVMVSPHMGLAGAKRCQDAGIAWFDLSGNGHVFAKDLRLHIEGRPRRYSRRGRPSNPFAPKSARVTRWLLSHLAEHPSQQDLAEATGLSPALVGRVVKRLEQLELLARDAKRQLRVVDPNLLLDAWRERYRFDGHRIIKGHIAARSAASELIHISDAFKQAKVKHAATGLSAAWAMTHHAAYRTNSLYIARTPPADALDALGFHLGDKGANTWLIIPDDEGVFDAGETCEGVACVHPVQVYLDLGHHPERSEEASDVLRTQYMSWIDDAHQ